MQAARVKLRLKRLKTSTGNLHVFESRARKNVQAAHSQLDYMHSSIKEEYAEDLGGFACVFWGQKGGVICGIHTNADGPYSTFQVPGVVQEALRRELGDIDTRRMLEYFEF